MDLDPSSEGLGSKGGVAGRRKGVGSLVEGLVKDDRG